MHLHDEYIALAIIIAFYLAVIAMRLFRIGKKRKCPGCNHSLYRTSKSMSDNLLIYLTLGLLPFKRYKCLSCGWEGLRWRTLKR